METSEARFRRELLAFCQGPLGIPDQASASRVADTLVQDVKSTVQRSNLEDLEDITKTYLVP